MTEQLTDFYNEGAGWICKRCESELAAEAGSEEHTRDFHEEAECEAPALTNAAHAKWMDHTRRVLICPRCGITEPVERS